MLLFKPEIFTSDIFQVFFFSFRDEGVIHIILIREVLERNKAY